MKLSEKQVGVLKGMATALLLSIGILAIGMKFDPFAFDSSTEMSGRLYVLGLALILPTITMTAAIARLARFRFFSPTDIDGSGLTRGSIRALVLQSLIQNTLEQFLIALAVYVTWCLTMPVTYLATVLCCSLAFAVGRLLFFRGYESGAASRAFGFALTFYPTVLLILVLSIYQLCSLIS